MFESPGAFVQSSKIFTLYHLRRLIQWIERSIGQAFFYSILAIQLARYPFATQAGRSLQAAALGPLWLVGSAKL